MNTTIIASEHVLLDSNVMTGGGTDQTEALQALLDKALEWGAVTLVMDGAALVRGLKLHSNTTIQCLNQDCGFFLADDSNCAIVTNAAQDYKRIQTRNITLLGGTYNHNCLHQAHDVPGGYKDFDGEGGDSYYIREVYAVMAMEFIGIENLNVRDITIRDQRTYAFTVGNFRHVNVENTYIKLDHEIPWGNQDGFHFWGPGQFLTMRNIGGKTEDDFMNIGPDEHDGRSSITDVLIDGVMLDHSWQGIRLLSHGTGLLDRVTIRNVTGTYEMFGFYITPWFMEDKNGRYGQITFENIDLRPDASGRPDINQLATDNPRFLFSIGGDIESLTFRNIHWHHPECSWNIFQIGYPYHKVAAPFIKVPRIRRLCIDGLQIMESAGNAVPTEYMLARGRIDRMILRDVEVLGAHPESCLLRTKDDADIGRLIVDRMDAENMNCLFDLTKGHTNTIAYGNILLSHVKELIKGNCNAISTGSITQLS